MFYLESDIAAPPSERGGWRGSYSRGQVESGGFGRQ